MHDAVDAVSSERAVQDCRHCPLTLAGYWSRLFFIISAQPYRVDTRNPSLVTVRNGFETVEMQR